MIIHDKLPMLFGESEKRVTLTNYSTEDVAKYVQEGTTENFVGEELELHPWNRGSRQNQVSVTVKSVDINRQVFPNDEHLDYSFVGIFDTDDFLDLVIAAFPDQLIDNRE